LKVFRTIDWSKANGKLWEGRAMVAGRLTKVQANVQLTANLLKGKLGVDLTEKEQELEDKHLRGRG